MTDPAWCSLTPGKSLDCLVCDKALVNDSGNCPNQPVYGLAFTTHGHWPSSLFDSMNGDHLEISICDECLTAKASRQVAFVKSKRHQCGDDSSDHDPETVYRLRRAAESETFVDLSDLTDDEYRARLRALRETAGYGRKREGAVKPIREMLTPEQLEALATVRYSRSCMLCGRTLNQPDDPSTDDYRGDCAACVDRIVDDHLDDG